ncbi:MULTISPECIES: urease accessory protein UreG [Corynebacterium]|uniref:Urease accessory protein UreG n=1 Tax=Corynebacterium amycolatum TaxID=43765 RepID=A0AB38XY07_CORAY|nr:MULTISPECIES: urease accessory protein UreG [Corynebacterium]AIN81689.1 urease accessory protein UreG [Corynebacterium sp. ATCC 6931]KAA9269525.1 urease accessory protein UreG [Corynebacterium amycolatum]KAA9289340.1 urease accessory protein UreG [Corynebacterium amycolatum]MBC6726216.1 urease accessory protein UreG [Corynebacterium amycolatum]MBC6758791.1 urease accessory protein UreG [Corynebacterium sp. LK24]
MVFHVGIGGPVGSGKTALIETLVPELISRGFTPGIITNDIYTQEDAHHIRQALDGVVDSSRIIGVETGSCPHTAVRDDPTMNLMASAELLEEHPDIDIVFYESGGDNLTLTFSPALADLFVFVLDTAEGQKMPKKRGPGITDSDVLVINKIDIAPYVRCDVDQMHTDALAVRSDKPVMLTNCLDGSGIAEFADLIEAAAKSASVDSSSDQA